MMLWHLYYHCKLDLLDIELMLVIGDEQTYDRMIKMKSAQPNNYRWLVPFPGEFHLCGHVLHCTFRLWWTHLLLPCRDILRMGRIEMDWGMKKFNEHDMFVRTVVCALLKWLEHICCRFRSSNKFLCAMLAKNDLYTKANCPNAI